MESAVKRFKYSDIKDEWMIRDIYMGPQIVLPHCISPYFGNFGSLAYDLASMQS